MDALQLGVVLAGTWTAAALAFQWKHAKAYGRRRLHAPPAGDPGQGVRYAFTKAMLPWAKESVRLNLASYTAGMVFHAGVFTAFGLLLAALVGVQLPAVLVRPAQVLTLAGGLGGASLLGKRLLKPQLRGLSVPDDFLANLLTTLFALLAFTTTLSAALETVWLLEAILLLVYAPLGKIRHCLFFFSTRYHLGAFFGRRGVFPPGGSNHA
jgi:hypothetical protein